MNLLSKILFVAVFITGFTTYSQFQNNRNPVGLDRSIGGAGGQPEPQKAEPVDYVKAMTERLTTRLQLDAFQSAVVKNLVEDFIKKNNEIALENIPNEAMIEKSKIAREEMEGKFLEIFTEKQKTLFKEFLIENDGKLKKNKKKKKKDTAEVAE